MKVIVHFKDGTSKEVAIPETEWSHPTAAQAIEYAQKQLSKREREQVLRYEAEEDFL